MDFDRILPGGGLRRGSLVEWLAASPGSGACLLALSAAREVCGDARPLVVIDSRGWFYPPPAVALGVDPRRLVVLRPKNARDASWALDQTLRCPGTGAVVAWPEKLDGHAYRRLQLAAETSGAVGCLMRSAAVRGQPSWADLRLLVSACPSTAGEWRVRVELLPCRGSRQEGVAELILDEPTSRDDETHPLSVAS